MNAMKKMLLIPTSALLLAASAGSAQADTQPLDRIDDILTYANDYGFSHIEEINVDVDDVLTLAA